MEFNSKNNTEEIMNSKKILIVDDDETILYSFQYFLEKEGYMPIVANSGEEALQKFTAEKPNCVFLDICLPDDDGLDVLNKLKGMNGQIPIFMITAYSTPEIKTKALQLGAMDYIKKPLSLKHIREMMNNIFMT